MTHSEPRIPHRSKFPLNTHIRRTKNWDLKYTCMVKTLCERWCCCLHQVQDPLWGLSFLAHPADLVPPTHKTFLSECLLLMLNMVLLYTSVFFPFGVCLEQFSGIRHELDIKEVLIIQKPSDILFFLYCVVFSLTVQKHFKIKLF